MRFIFIIFISFPVLAAEHQGPCAKKALIHALKNHRKGEADFSMRLPSRENPEELHIYEVGFKVKDSFYHGEVAVEFIRGKCLQPKLQYLTMLD